MHRNNLTCINSCIRTVQINLNLNKKKKKNDQRLFKWSIIFCYVLVIVWTDV